MLFRSTDANGIFVFSNLIAAQPATQGQYRLFITMTPLGSTVDYPNGTAQTNLDTITVAVGGTATRNVTLTNCAVGSTLPGCAPAGILPLSSSKSQDIRFSTMGDRLEGGALHRIEGSLELRHGHRTGHIPFVVLQDYRKLVDVIALMVEGFRQRLKALHEIGRAHV